MSYRVKRKVDPLGRVVLPVEIRRTLDIECGDDIEISLEGNHVRLDTCYQSCLFCGSDHGLYEIGKQYICRKCINEVLDKLD